MMLMMLKLYIRSNSTTGAVGPRCDAARLLLVPERNTGNRKEYVTNRQTATIHQTCDNLPTNFLYYRGEGSATANRKVSTAEGVDRRLYLTAGNPAKSPCSLILFVTPAIAAILTCDSTMRASQRKAQYQSNSSGYIDVISTAMTLQASLA